MGEKHLQLFDDLIAETARKLKSIDDGGNMGDKNKQISLFLKDTKS